MAEPTSTDKMLDKVVDILRDMRAGDKFQPLWKLFNILAGVVKEQARLILAMDRELRGHRKRLDALDVEVERLKKATAKHEIIN